MAAYSSASNTDTCHGRGKRGEPVMESSGWRDLGAYYAQEDRKVA